MAATGTLAVALLNAQGLKDVEGILGGRQDPYCVVTVGAKSYRSNTNTDGGKNPVWNQLFTFHNVTVNSELNIELFDENVLMRDKVIGNCSLPLNQIPMGSQPLDVRLPVYTSKGKQRGEIALKLQFQALTSPSVQLQGPGAATMGIPPRPPGYPAPGNATGQGYTQGSAHHAPPAQRNSYNNGYDDGFNRASAPAAQQRQNSMASSKSGMPGRSPSGLGRMPSARPAPAPAPAPVAARPSVPTGGRTYGSSNSRVLASRRYRPDIWVLPTYADTYCWDHYDKGALLGKGTYGTTYLANKKGSTEKVAVKVISKRKLSTPEEVGDVQREVAVMHHLKGHPNVVALKDVFEDPTHICMVMELCTGGELFDAIMRRGEFTEYDAASIMRPILSVVEHCHNMGVMHRDIKPENFLFANKAPGAPIKLTDFGVSCFFKEGETRSEWVGSTYYVAPEVLARQHSKEADVWSCGVILYMLLSGEAPFQGADENETFDRIHSMPIELTGGAWDNITDLAKDCVLSMLERDPVRRATAVEVLRHEWMRENGAASDNPIEAEVFRRIKKFSGMNALRREALLVIAGNLPMDEISGLREMFLEIDKDRSGSITVDEFTAALERKGQTINMAAAKQVMAEADVNGDGILDYEEFLAAMVNAGKLDREEMLKAAFEEFDTDGSGCITRDELKVALQSKTRFTDEEIDTIIDEADRNSDGMIDFEEFCLMMRAM